MFHLWDFMLIVYFLSPAAVSAFSKSDGQGQLITFTKEDFLAGVTGEEELSAIVVSALPSGGTLRLAGRDVRPGEAILPVNR